MLYADSRNFLLIMLSSESKIRTKKKKLGLKKKNQKSKIVIRI